MTDFSNAGVINGRSQRTLQFYTGKKKKKKKIDLTPFCSRRLAPYVLIIHLFMSERSGRKRNNLSIDQFYLRGSGFHLVSKLCNNIL